MYWLMVLLKPIVTHEIKKQEGEQTNNPCIVLLDYWAKLLDTFFIYNQKDIERFEQYGSITLVYVSLRTVRF